MSDARVSAKASGALVESLERRILLTAADNYESNDDLSNAHPLTGAAEMIVQATLHEHLSGRTTDIDYYWFLAPSDVPGLEFGTGFEFAIRGEPDALGDYPSAVATLRNIDGQGLAAQVLGSGGPSSYVSQDIRAGERLYVSVIGVDWEGEYSLTLTFPSDGGGGSGGSSADNGRTIALDQPAFNGEGHDLFVRLDGMSPGVRVEIFAGPSRSNLQPIATTESQGHGEQWFGVDLADAPDPIFLAGYVQVRSEVPFRLVDTHIAHPDLDSLSSGETEYHNTALSKHLSDYLVSSALDRFRGVATLRQWDFANGRYGQGSVDLTQAQRSGRRLIALTHGWNDGLDADAAREYMVLFARELGAADPAASEKYTVVAIEWLGGPNGSDPNGVTEPFRDFATTALGDARRSAENGIQIGRVLGETFHQAGIDPRDLMLVGHSNGAGLVASLATELHARTGRRVSELVALDAPWRTASYSTTYEAWDAVDRVTNVFGGAPNWNPLQYRSETDLLDLAFDALLGFGMVMPESDRAITNVELSAPATAVLLRSVEPLSGGHPVGLPDTTHHNWIPLRWALSAGALGDEFWSFAGSGFATRSTPVWTGWYQHELRELVFESLDAAMNHGVEISQHLREWAVSEALGVASDIKSFWDSLVGGAAAAIDGLNASVRQIPTVGSLPVLHLEAASPVAATFELTIPTGAVSLSFDLSVLESGNAGEELWIAFDDEVLQRLPLAAFAATPGDRVRVSLGDLGGRSGTLSLYMPSDRPSDAEMVVSDLRFDIAEDQSGSPSAWTELRVGSRVSVASDNSGSAFVASITDDGRPLLFEQRGDDWIALDLLNATGAEGSSAKLTAGVDPEYSLPYVVASTPAGVILFWNDYDDVWLVTNLTEDLAHLGAEPLREDISVFVWDGLIYGAGTTTSGDLALYFQEQDASAPEGWRYRYQNLSTTDLAPQRNGTPEFSGRIINYVTRWSQPTIAGLDPEGNLWGVWFDPRDDRWESVNLSQITGAPRAVGGLSAYLPLHWNGINLTAVDESGNLIVTWWSAGHQWAQTNMTERFGGPRFIAESVASYVTPWNGLNIVGLSTSTGELEGYWWVPEFQGDWKLTNISRQVAGSTPPYRVVEGHSARSGARATTLAGITEEGELVRFWWAPAQPTVWHFENLSQLAAD